MAHKSFSYKGYDIYLAAIQPSKRARGGHMRTLQIRRADRIVKSIRYDTNDVYAYGRASIKAAAWIDNQLR